MKPIKNNSINSCFPCTVGKYNWLLFFIIFYVNGTAQIHISGNTVFTIAENTTIHVADQQEEMPIIVQKETPSKKSKQIAKQEKKSKKPLQPPIVIKDTGPEKKSVLSFSSVPKTPSALLYSDKSIRIALLNSGNFVVKLFPPKKAKNNSIHTIFLNDNDQQMETSFAGTLPKPQNHLENQITRPPPTLTKAHSRIA